uniref:Uncharacterized protein n=1 Tax=Anopheles atroparvus TaxID=41427 RepID=A0A182JKG3_ANOAO
MFGAQTGTDTVWWYVLRCRSGVINTITSFPQETADMHLSTVDSSFQVLGSANPTIVATRSYTNDNRVILQRNTEGFSCYKLKERDIRDLAHTQPSIVHLSLDTLFSANKQFLRTRSAFLPKLKRI